MQVDQAINVVEQLLDNLRYIKSKEPNAQVKVVRVPDGGYSGDAEEFPYEFVLPDLDEWIADGKPGPIVLEQLYHR